jgi:polar amino acid transport system permease protein
MDTLFQWNAIEPWLPYLAKGLGVTVLLAVLAATFGLILGILLAVLRHQEKTAWITKAYVDVFRGTPLLLQLSIIYFSVPQIVNRVMQDLLGWDVKMVLAGMVAATITFSLNSGAYLSEIIRSGIQSVDAGEVEAAKALGVSRYHTFKDIVFPIAFRNVFPAMMNEFTTLIKESSIVSLIGIQDLMRRQQIVSSQTYMYFEPLIVVGLIYYVVIKGISWWGLRIERRLAHD